MNNGIFGRSALLVLLSTVGTIPAYAQEPVATETAAEDRDDVIVVTANRREENLQDVSGVVQTLGADQLRRDGISDLRNLQVAIPGLSISNQEGNVEIFIRGVGSANSTELGDPGAAPHLNGTYIPRPRGLGLMFYDLERVEVNKGPQGTLYGRNAVAGTLNIITAKPRLGEFGGYAQAEFGNRSSYGAEGAINIPLGDTFALRAAGYYINRDFGFKNVSTGALERPETRRPRRELRRPSVAALGTERSAQHLDRRRLWQGNRYWLSRREHLQRRSGDRPPPRQAQPQKCRLSRPAGRHGKRAVGRAGQDQL